MPSTKRPANGVPHLVLDGKIFESDRCRTKTVSVKGEQIDAWYSGKTADFGGDIQMLCEPDGFPIRTSDVEPGGVADLEAARTHVPPTAYPATRAMPILADPGHQGAGHGVHVPFKQPTGGNVPSVDNRTYNALQRALRSLGERGFALLPERWTTLKHITLSPAESATSSPQPSSWSISNTAGSPKSQRENVRSDLYFTLVLSTCIKESIDILFLI